MEHQVRDMTSAKPLHLITLVVGRGVSMDALAAVGLTGSLNFLVLGFIIGLSQGVGILCSQYFGSREYAQLRKSVTMSFYLNFSTGALLTVLSMVSARQLLVWISWRMPGCISK